MGKKYRNTVGRQQGRKNLKRLDDGRMKNQHGVVFTDADKRALASKVNSANRRRRQQLKEVATLPRTIRGVNTGDTLATKLQMGYESDFIITPKTKSLQRFTSRDQFDNYLAYLDRVNSKDYLDERTRLYKRNYIKAIDDVHGDDAKDIKMKIRMMRPAEFRKLIEGEELAEINDVYAPEDKAASREKLRAVFGMKSKEDDALENYDDIEG